MVRAEIVDERIADPGSVEETRRRLDMVAWLMDSAIEIPGLKVRMGVDSILGLLPVVGDAISALISTYIVAEAARLGAPRPVIARMTVNVLTDTIVGMVPVAGDVFDVAWKANRKNVQLLSDYLDQPKKTSRRSWWYLCGTIGFLVALLAVLGLIIVGAFKLMAAAFT